MKKKDAQFLKILNMLENGETLVDIAIEMGNRGVNAMRIPQSDIYLMASFGKANAIDVVKGEHYRVFSLAYDKYQSTVHYVFYGTKEKGWQVTTEDTQIQSIYDSFLKDLEKLSQNTAFQKSFENTGVYLENIQWSGRETRTFPNADFSDLSM